jgi:hypothetical protein
VGALGLNPTRRDGVDADFARAKQERGPFDGKKPLPLSSPNEMLPPNASPISE